MNSKKSQFQSNGSLMASSYTQVWFWDEWRKQGNQELPNKPSRVIFFEKIVISAATIYGLQADTLPSGLKIVSTIPGHYQKSRTAAIVARRSMNVTQGRPLSIPVSNFSYQAWEIANWKDYNLHWTLPATLFNGLLLTHGKNQTYQRRQYYNHLGRMWDLVFKHWSL